MHNLIHIKWELLILTTAQWHDYCHLTKLRLIIYTSCHEDDDCRLFIIKTKIKTRIIHVKCHLKWIIAKLQLLSILNNLPISSRAHMNTSGAIYYIAQTGKKKKIQNRAKNKQTVTTDYQHKQPMNYIVKCVIVGWKYSLLALFRTSWALSLWSVQFLYNVICKNIYKTTANTVNYYYYSYQGEKMWW